MKTVAFIVPGFNESTKEEKYQNIAKMFRKKGYKTEMVEIYWKRRLMSDYKNDVIKAVKKFPNHEIVLLGFSFGAYASFLAASELNPKCLFLCSLSPYFAEDLDSIPEYWLKFLGKNRALEFPKMYFNGLSKKVKSKTFLFAGDKEPKQVGNRVFVANKLIKNSELIIIKGSKHDIANPDYQISIETVIQSL